MKAVELAVSQGIVGEKSRLVHVEVVGETSGLTIVSPSRLIGALGEADAVVPTGRKNAGSMQFRMPPGPVTQSSAILVLDRL
jgi:hypothetical protein